MLVSVVSRRRVAGVRAARVRTDARLDGAGATGEQIAAYFGAGHQIEIGLF